MGFPARTLIGKLVKEDNNPSPLNFPTGIGGTLYPPSIFHSDVLKKSLFKKLCFMNDDIWLYWMWRMQGAMCRWSGALSFNRHANWPGTQETSLWNYNKNGNDEQIQAMFEAYGFPSLIQSKLQLDKIGAKENKGIPNYNIEAYSAEYKIDKSSSSADIITVALCFDDDFTVNAAVTLFSLAKNVNKNKNIHAYLITPGLTTDNIARIERVASKTSNLSIHHLDADKKKFAGLPFPTWASQMANHRMEIPIRLNEKDKVLYLDSDTLVLGDISEIWEQSFDNNHVLACIDQRRPTVSEALSRDALIENGLNPYESYFNSGVLMINTKKWVVENIHNRFIDIYKKYTNKLIYGDQDIINILFTRKIKKLDSIWNVISTTFFSKQPDYQRFLLQRRLFILQVL
jgi:lipopolysaccharide biosynthesis glycosyltransferase